MARINDIDENFGTVMRGTRRVTPEANRNTNNPQTTLMIVKVEGIEDPIKV